MEPLYKQIDIKELKDIIENKKAFYEVLKEIGYIQIYSKKTIKQLKEYCKINSINYSHLSEDRSLEFLTCKECGEIKFIKDFYVYNNKVQHVCLKCKTKKQMQYARNNIDILNEYKKTLKCAKCSENRFYLLDFHHKDPNQKEYTISKRTNTKLETLMPEIEKCVVLCSNCHREYHYLNKINKIKLEDYLEG